MDTIQTLRVKPPQIAQTYLPERLARLDDNRQLLLGTQLASLGQRRFADPHLHNNCRRLLGAQFASLGQRPFADPRLRSNCRRLLGAQFASLGQWRFADPHLRSNCRRLLGAQFASLGQWRFADNRLHRAPTIGRGRERSLSSYASREEPKASSPR